MNEVLCNAMSEDFGDEGKEVCILDEALTPIMMMLLQGDNLNKLEEKVKMDYQTELKRLQEGSNFWRPKVGQFKVKALSELEESTPYIQRKLDGTEEKHEQYKLKILVNGEERIWTFGKGITPASTYGQLVDLATKKGNMLTNVEFTVIVKSDGTKNDYTIAEL